MTFSNALSRVADNMDIHVVQAELHRAAETGGAELKRGEETALYLFSSPDME